MNKRKKRQNKRRTEKKDFFLGKIIPKLLMFSFLSIACVQTVNAVFISMAPEYVNAQELELQVPIGTYGDENNKITFDQTTGPIAEYIKVVYQYATGIVGIIAAVVLMWGGVLWLTSAGNSSRVGEAQAWIGAALTGLALVFGSYLILYQINPNLTSFKKLSIIPVDKLELPTSDCKWVEPIETNGKLFDGDIACAGYDIKWKKATNACTEQKPDSNYTCCCPPLVDGCLPNTRCKECNNCNYIPNSLQYYDGQGKIKREEAQLNTGVLKKLEEFKLNKGYLGYSLDFIITEAWPPSVWHDSDCHQDGTCLDIDIIGETNTPQFRAQLSAFYKSLVSYFPNTYWECQGSNCCSTYPSDIKCRPAGTGTHFHVQQ